MPELPLPVTATPAQWCERGSHLQNLDRFDEAAEAFTQALAIDPDFAGAYFGLGYGLLMQEAYEDGRQYYEQGLIVDDSDAAAWNNLGSIYTALERWEEAVACYETALEIDPAYANAHYNMGNVYKEVGQPSETAACFRRAIYIDPAAGRGPHQPGRDSHRAAPHSRGDSPAIRGRSKFVPMMPRPTCTARSRGSWPASGKRVGTNTSGGSATT